MILTLLYSSALGRPGLLKGEVVISRRYSAGGVRKAADAKDRSAGRRWSTCAVDANANNVIVERKVLWSCSQNCGGGKNRLYPISPPSLAGSNYQRGESRRQEYRTAVFLMLDDSCIMCCMGELSNPRTIVITVAAVKKMRPSDVVATTHP